MAPSTTSGQRDTRRHGPDLQAHSARMDRVYRFQRHFYDATRPIFLLGRDRLLRGIVVPPGGAILEVGCGTGRNLRVLARQLPGTSLFGLDVSAEMLRTAKARLPARLTGRVTLARAAADEADPRTLFARTEPFDAIVFSYSLSMVSDREAAMERAFAALAPGGTIHLVDFGPFQGWPGPLRAAAAAWLNLWHVHPDPAMAAILRRPGVAVCEESILGGYAVLVRACRESSPAASGVLTADRQRATGASQAASSGRRE